MAVDEPSSEPQGLGLGAAPPEADPAASGADAAGGTDAADEPSQPPPEPPAEGDEKPVAFALLLSTMAALALAVVYIAGGQAQAEGALLFVALGGIGVALGLWAKRLLPQGEVTSERGDLPSTREERISVKEAVEGQERWLSRRKVLFRLLGAAGGALGLAAVFPIRSLGPSPGRSLERTAWRRGLRLIDDAGRPVRLDTLQVGSILTVFPEGREQAGDSQTVLIRVESALLRPREGRESWSPEGYVAYSKICPHVGCPVGLYQADRHELICPCHQSTFDVLDGARPNFGPATRSLPQLPLRVDPNGFLVADGDFTEPVGPGYWNRE